MILESPGNIMENIRNCWNFNKICV